MSWVFFPWTLSLFLTNCLSGLTPASRVALAELASDLAQEPDGLVDAIDVFTDGSLDGTHSAWSFVAVYRSRQRPVAVRWAAGQVCVDRDSQEWLGALSHGALQAEHTAAAWATFWMLVNRPIIDVVSHSDSICTVMRANGQWQLAAKDTLSNTCRSIAQAIDCMRRLRPCDIRHVKGHSGNPWNELADSLAKHALHAACTVLHGSGISGWIRECSLDGLWLLLSAFLEPDMWPQHCGVQMVDPGIVFPEAMPPVGDVLQNRTATAGIEARWHALRVATLNVQTMAEGAEESQAHAGRAAFLRTSLPPLGLTLSAYRRLGRLHSYRPVRRGGLVLPEL